MQFEWDEAKNLSNIAKHGISFEEASTAFLDLYSFVFDDPDHSSEEDRFILIGMTTQARVCVVCHCYRSADETIRIISARKATKKEAQSYERRI